MLKRAFVVYVQPNMDFMVFDDLKALSDSIVLFVQKSTNSTPGLPLKHENQLHLWKTLMNHESAFSTITKSYLWSIECND